MFDFLMPKVPTISAEELYHVLVKKEKVVLLDVRTPEEFAKTRIAGSINVPVDEIGKQIKRVAPDKNQKIYIYCFSGSRGIMAVDTMTKLGYTNVFNMQSGLLAWRMKKYPLEA